MSGLFKLNFRDLVNGLIMAVGSSVLTAIEQVIAASGPESVYTINWRLIGGVGIAAAVMYLLKNFGTPDNGATFGIQAMAVAPPPPKGK